MQIVTKQQIQLLHKLHQKKYRDAYGLFFVEGEKGVIQACASDFEIESIFVDEVYDLSLLPRELHNRVFLIHSHHVKTIKSVKTWPHVMAIVKKKEYAISELYKSNCIVVLYKINDPGNVGTIIRTCHWFGVKHIVLSEGSVDPYNEKVVRSSMGSVFFTHIYETQSVIDVLKELKEKDFYLSSFDISGKEEQLGKKKKHILLFGSESHGISQEILSVSDEVIRIKGKEEMNSLNVAVSVGIGLYMKG